MHELKPFLSAVDEHCDVMSKLKSDTQAIEQANELIISTLRSGKKLMLCGNGGSAADSQHIAAEFVVRYSKERQALPAIALTTDTSILTAHSNDYDFSTVFSRQLEALGTEGDCLIAISTSGNSANIIEAVKSAKLRGIKTIGMTGSNGGDLKGLVDINIAAPTDITARVQEVHILVAHWWCESVDSVAVNSGL